MSNFLKEDLTISLEPASVYTLFMKEEDMAGSKRLKRISPDTFWIVLTAISFGLLIPCLIATKRNLKAKKKIFTLTIASLITSLIIPNPITLFVWLGALLFSIFSRQKEIAGSNAFETVVPVQPSKAEETEVISGKRFSSIKNGLEVTREWFHYNFTVRREIRETTLLLNYESQLINRMTEEKAAFTDLVKVITPKINNANSEMSILEFYGCGLIEVRKGARVTHRESTYSGSYGGGSLRMGPVSVGGGRSSGYSSSTSISYPAPDELTLIDHGKFLLTTSGVSVVGSKFTKSTDFKKMIDFQTSGRQILFAPKTGTKVWIIEFPKLWQAIIVRDFLYTAFSSLQDNPNSKMSAINSDNADIMKENFKLTLAEIDYSINESEEKLQEYREVLKNFQELYPNKVHRFDV